MIGYRIGFRSRALPLGPDQSARFLPWLFAFLIYVAGLAGLGLVVFQGSLRASEDALATTMTLQVPVDVTEARLETVLARWWMFSALPKANPAGSPPAMCIMWLSARPAIRSRSPGARCAVLPGPPRQC